MPNRHIDFEVGDVARCPYYDFTGEIVEFKESDGIDYIILVGADGQRCSAQLRVKSLNSPLPCYLQLVCTADEKEEALAHVLKLSKAKKE